LYIRDASTPRFTFERTTGNLTATGTIQASGTGTTLSQGITMGSGFINHNSTFSRDKIRVFSNNAHVIGFDQTMTFGSLNNYAMTLQVGNVSTSGWWFGD